MSDITKDTVKRIAFLSRIEIEDSEINTYQDKLNSILHWIDKLQEVNVENVEPMASVVDIKPEFRADEVSEKSMQKEVLLNAPDAEDGFFTVPKVVE